MQDLLYISYDNDETKNEKGLCIGRPKEYGAHDILNVLVNDSAKNMYDTLTNPHLRTVFVLDGATNEDILKTIFPDLQWDNECNGIIYGYKTNDRVMPMIGVSLDWLKQKYKGERK